jgi:hypothetical protein
MNNIKHVISINTEKLENIKYLLLLKYESEDQSEVSVFLVSGKKRIKLNESESNLNSRQSFSFCEELTSNKNYQLEFVWDNLDLNEYFDICLYLFR